MTAYDPEIQKRAAKLIEKENFDKPRKCNACGKTLSVIGVSAINNELIRVDCHCGYPSHNEHAFTVGIRELENIPN
jgi:hypothetical protein